MLTNYDKSWHENNISKCYEQELLILVYYDFETRENAILIVLGKVSISSRCVDIFAQFLWINNLNKSGIFRRSRQELGFGPPNLQYDALYA